MIETDEVEYDNKVFQVQFEDLAPGITVYKNAIPTRWDVINRIENSLSMEGTRFAWSDAQVGYGELVLDARKCKDWKISDINLEPRDQFSEDAWDIWENTMTSLKICLEHYKPRNYLDQIEYYECINVVRYGKGEFFAIHTDDGEPYRCTTSAVGYPNDDYEGGELYFPLFDVKYKPEAGDLVINPSAYTYAHSSEPVTNDGLKYSFVIMMDRSEIGHRKDSPTYHVDQD